MNSILHGTISHLKDKSNVKRCVYNFILTLPIIIITSIALTTKLNRKLYAMLRKIFW